MEKKATEEVVWAVCEQFTDEGRKVSGRAVLKEVGGSMTTVLAYIDSWKAQHAKNKAVTPEILANVHKSITTALEQNAAQVTAELHDKLEEASEREQEIMEVLADSEQIILRLEGDLIAAQAEITALHQANMIEVAVVTEKNAALQEQVNNLLLEKNHIISASDAVKAQQVKTKVNLTHAEHATAMAKKKIMVLEQQVSELNKIKSEVEQKLAAGERHVEDLSGQIMTLAEQVTSANVKLDKADSMIANLDVDIKNTLSKQHKAEGIAEQMAIHLKESTTTIEHLRSEQTTDRNEVAFLISELLALHVNEKVTTAAQEPVVSDSEEKDSDDVTARAENVNPQPDVINMKNLRKRMESLRAEKYKRLALKTGEISDLS